MGKRENRGDREGKKRGIEKSTNHPDIESLYAALLSIQTQEELHSFLNDLCTPGELKAMADRWKTARLLEQGIAYRAIYEKTGISTATVTRVARSLTMGAGGYQKVLSRWNKKKEKTEGKRK